MNRVRFAREFFDQLDVLVPIENGLVNDLPRRNDFEATVLHIIFEQFRDYWDELLSLRGNDSYQSVIGVGLVVPAYSVQGYRFPDGTVLVQQVSIDFDLDW